MGEQPKISIDGLDSKGETFENISLVLDNETTRQRALNYGDKNVLWTVEKISEAFNVAKDSQDPLVIKEALRSIHDHLAYMSEKYRDTREERKYLEQADIAVRFLETRLKECSK